MRRVVFSSTGDLTRAGRVDNTTSGSRIASILTTAAASLFATVFPSDCRFCGAPLIKVSRIPVCDVCLDTIQRLEGNFCHVCGDGLLTSATKSNACCGECLKDERPFTRAVAYGAYDGALRDLIHLLKYDRVRPVAGVLGRMVSEGILEIAPEIRDDHPLVVPVPLHTSKLRERGFNQSELIASAALKLAKIGELRPEILRRGRATESQTGLSPQQRRNNMRGAFAVTCPDEIVGKNIILVDDVFTTGTTVSEAARVLLRAGASRVWVVTVARVLLRERIGAPISDPDADDIGTEAQFAKAARA